MVATEAVERSISCPRAQWRRRRSRCQRHARRSILDRCASAAASATAFTGRCARPALRRRSRRNIWPLWRPRSTSAKSRRATASTWCSGRNRDLLYAGLDRAAAADLQLVRWNANGRSKWIDAANADKPAPVVQRADAAGRRARSPHISAIAITRSCTSRASTPGVDIGASWGSPIVAAGDGEVVGAGWAGGYGREVRDRPCRRARSACYGHMSEIVAAPGSFVRAGQLIGYVGSSRPLDRPAPPLRGPARRHAGQSARRALLQRAGGGHGARQRGEGTAESLAQRGDEARLTFVVAVSIRF